MIYLHVPFCESRCTYCGFYSNVILSEAKNLCYEAYSDAVCAEIAARREEIAQTLEVNTLYIGGGTPSVLPLDVLSRIVNAIKGNSLSPEGAMPPNPPRSALRPVSPSASHPFMWPRAATGSAGIPLPASDNETVILSEAKNLFPWSEFTVEVNPEDIVERGEEYVEGLKSLGVNRISMGVQSFDDSVLRWMNRRHDAATAEEAFRLLRRCGIRNISLDLIFGISCLDDSAWSATIDKTLALGPEHISAYQLSIEEGSALDRLVSKGEYSEATEDQCRRQYDMLCSRLARAGFRHYEVSNFSLPGFEAVHNSAYWRRVPYVGLGPGAHSLSSTSVRSWNTATLRSYSREQEILSSEDIRIERIMLPLRTDKGIPESELRALAGDEPVDRLLAAGALVRTQDPLRCHPSHCHPERSEGSLRIPEDRLFTSDEIIRELL